MGQTSSFILPGKILKLVIGIGNPGFFFTNTKHNAGILIIDHFIKKYNLERHRISGGDISFLKQADGYTALFKSNSYMNLSGSSVVSAMEFCNIKNLQDIIIIHDDLETDLGKTKFQVGGSAKGHKGIKSAIAYLKETDFKRIRVGIGRPSSRNSWIVSSYVTSSFSLAELKILEDKTYPQCSDLLKEHFFFN